MPRAKKQVTEEVKKVRRRRKPMTEAQKKAAAERLEKARAAKAPAQNISVHESIRDLDDDHPLSPKNVKEWIKDWKLRLHGIRHHRTSKEAKEVGNYYSTEAYIRNMQNYLSTGVWHDMFYGENRNMPYYPACVKPSYDKDGNIKRSYGVYYADLDGVYGKNGQVIKV